MSKPAKHINIEDYIKASLHGEWLANNENESGFVSKHKVHKSLKQYTRKLKHKHNERTLNQQG